MTFNALEVSRWLGRPVALFRFTLGPLTWLYTSADREIVVGADTYLPLAISRSGIAETTENPKNNVTITLPISATLAGVWRPYPPSSRVDVTCMALHQGDGEVAVEWVGRVLSPSYTDTQLALVCEPSRSSARRAGLQLKWSRGCTVALYSQGVGMCNVDKADHALAAELTAVSGLTLTATAFGTLPVSRLAGGMVEWITAEGLTEFRTIMAHTGTSIVVNYGHPEFLSGLELTVYPGCAHNDADCHDYFDNRVNYGGCKYMTVKNPFDGSPVW